MRGVAGRRGMYGVECARCGIFMEKWKGLAQEYRELVDMYSIVCEA